MCFLWCVVLLGMLCFFFFKQKTAYEMRISDWSSDVCFSDLTSVASTSLRGKLIDQRPKRIVTSAASTTTSARPGSTPASAAAGTIRGSNAKGNRRGRIVSAAAAARALRAAAGPGGGTARSEEHTSELQSLMRTSEPAFC